MRLLLLGCANCVRTSAKHWSWPMYVFRAQTRRCWTSCTRTMASTSTTWSPRQPSTNTLASTTLPALSSMTAMVSIRFTFENSERLTLLGAVCWAHGMSFAASGWRFVVIHVWALSLCMQVCVCVCVCVRMTHTYTHRKRFRWLCVWFSLIWTLLLTFYGYTMHRFSGEKPGHIQCWFDPSGTDLQEQVCSDAVHFWHLHGNSNTFIHKVRIVEDKTAEKVCCLLPQTWSRDMVRWNLLTVQC